MINPAHIKRPLGGDGNGDTVSAPTAGECMSERSDDYARIVCVLNDRWRVIVCKGDWQWILQKSKAEGGHGRAWRGVSYFREREGLLKACARLDGGCDPDALETLAALPKNFKPKPGSKA